MSIVYLIQHLYYGTIVFTSLFCHMGFPWVATPIG